MKTAIYDGARVDAGPEAPQRAICPACSDPVILKKCSTWYYGHAHKRLADPSPCPLSHAARRAEQDPEGERWPDDPYYSLTLAVVRQTILDGLDGYGLDALDGLLEPIPQAGLQQLMGTPPGQTEQITRKACARLRALDDDTRRKVRHAVLWGSIRQLEESLRCTIPTS